MKAAQQGGGGGGGQHGSLLAGGTALPGGPSPQPGQPGSLMQGGAYRTTVKKAIISIVWWISDLRNDREAFNYYLYVCVCVYIYLEDQSRGSKSQHDFCMPLTRSKILFSRIGSLGSMLDRIVGLNETTFARFKRINQVRGKKKREEKGRKKFRAAVIFAARM